MSTGGTKLPHLCREYDNYDLYFIRKWSVETPTSSNTQDSCSYVCKTPLCLSSNCAGTGKGRKVATVGALGYD